MMSLQQEDSITQPTPRHTTSAIGCREGYQFEIKIAALIGVRGLWKNDDFKLFSNKKDTGNFDDIVYTADEQWYFIQLKHSNIPEKKELAEGELDKLLKKCFESYCKMRHNNASGKTNKKQNLFVIYTNRDLHPEILQHETQKKDVKLFFTTCEETIFQYKGKETLLHTSLYGAHNQRQSFENSQYWDHFLKELIIATRQKGSRELDSLIAEEIRNHDAIQDDSTDYISIFYHFIETLGYWWSNANGEHMTPEKVTEWLQKAKSVQYTPLVHMLNKRDRTEINFSSQATTRLRTELSNKRAVHLRSDALTLCSILLLDCLPQSKCIFVTFESLQSNENMLLYAWLGGHWEWLIVSCDSAVQQSDISHTCLKISEIIKLDLSNKHVIILTEYSVQDVRGFDPVEHKFSFEQLSEKSREMVRDKKIDFQGCEEKMRSVLQRHGNVEHVLGPDLVTDLVTEGTPVNIGGKMYVNTGYYAPRVLKMAIYLQLNVLGKLNTHFDVFAVIGMTEEELFEIVPSCQIVGNFNMGKGVKQIYGERMGGRFILLSTEDKRNGFSEVCKNFKNKKLHWLKYVPNDRTLLWKMSKGGTVDLLEFVDAGKTRASKEIIKQCMTRGSCEVSQEAICDSGERTVLVVAEPGMGKSSTTTQVARHTKERDPTSWVVRINWNDHTRKLQEMSVRKFNFDSLVEFLCSAAFPESKYKDFNRSLLKQALQSSGNVTVLMDGFDEISPTYADKAAVILSELIKTKVGRVWVTSRPTQRGTLEKKLGVPTFTMKRLSKKCQRELFYGIWKKKSIGKADESEMRRGLAQVNQSVYQSNLTGCPLFITMFASAFRSGSFSLTPKLNLPDLYDKVVDMKLHIYETVKKREDLTIASVLDDHERLMETYLENVEICSLLVTVPSSELNSLPDNIIGPKIETFMKRVRDGTDKIGIVINVVEGKPQFVYRTFAEYFTARWFSKNFELSRSILEHILFNPEYSFVRDMFNKILARGCPLHCAVLDRDSRLLRTLLKGGCDVNAVDKGGRTAMHLIAAVGHGGSKYKEITNSLLRHGASVDTKDDVLQWTPEQYAVKAKNSFVLQRVYKN